MIPGGRRSKLLVLGLAGLAAVVLGAVLVEVWGDHLLGALGAATLLLLLADILRSEQRTSHVLRRLDRLEKGTKAQGADLRRVRAIAKAVAPQRRALGRIEDHLKPSIDAKVRRELRRDSRRSFEQVQATINLFSMVEVRAAVPPMRLWAVSPDALTLLLQELLSRRPSLVVECGSGTSTLWLALAAKQHGIDTRIVALDHEREFTDKTNRLLRQHGVDDIAIARHAPIVDVQSDDGTRPWYDPSEVSDLDGIGLLFVDGPPVSTGPLARRPALPQLWDRFAPEISIVVDDFIREDEQEIVKAWMASHPELEREHHDTEKGTEILRRG